MTMPPSAAADLTQLGNFFPSLALSALLHWRHYLASGSPTKGTRAVFILIQILSNPKN